VPSKTRHSSILMVLAFYLGFTSLQAEGQSQKAASPQKNVVNQAYQAIQNRRRQIVNKYVEALFTIGELCVTKKYTEAGRKITERILKVVEPPKNRRKVTSVAAGIGLDQTGDRQVLEKGLVVAEVHQKPLSPEDTQHLNEVREKVAALREKLGISGKAEEKAADPNPLQLPPSDDKDDAKKPEGEKDPQKKTKTSTTKVEPGSQGKKAGSNPQEKASAPGEEEIDNKEKSAREALISSVEKLGNQCLKQGYPAHAYEILLWAIEIDPDNKNLRRTVRENAYTDKSGKLHWYSPYDLAKAKQGYIEHPEYGWVTPAQIKALDAGKLWYKGQWMPKDFVDNQRQKWENRWTYETEHFEVFTNAPLRDAVVFGREVERLYSLFFRVLIDF